MNKFDCKHKNLYEDYYISIPCSTPYCYGSEIHCRDCGLFVSTCLCGSENFTSGWPHQRWENFMKKKYKYT